MDRFIVRPRTNGFGFELLGGALSDRQLFAHEDDAIAMRSRVAESGARKIEVRDTSGGAADS